MQYLTQETALRVIMKLANIMASNYLEQLCLAFLQDGVNVGIQPSLTVQE